MKTTYQNSLISSYNVKYFRKKIVEKIKKTHFVTNKCNP